MCVKKSCNCLQGRSPRRFTWQQLSRLNKRHNAHVAVRGKVYDVSGFIEKHPGGSQQLLLGAGRDVTVLFESYHNFNVSKVLEKYYVGELVTNEMPVFPVPGLFYRTLRERVERYFRENKIDPKICYWMFLRYIVVFLMAMLFWAGMIMFHESVLLGSLMSVGWGFFSAVVSMTSFHDASHFAITHKPWMWITVGSLHEMFQGNSFIIWIHQHIVGHHPYTNIDGADPDIQTASVDFRRIKWCQQWMSPYLYQHLYVPLTYCLLGLKTRLQDILILASHQTGTVRMNPLPTFQYVLFFTTKLIHTFYRFVIPCFFMSWTSVILYNLISELVSSYWLALIFQASHVVSEVEWTKPDEKDKVVTRDWQLTCMKLGRRGKYQPIQYLLGSYKPVARAEMQVASTQDYATGSWFWTVFTGALNHQTAHHLFPGVIQSHYPLITPILRQTCLEFGITYHHKLSVWDTFSSHFNHLKNLGQTPFQKMD